MRPTPSLPGVKYQRQRTKGATFNGHMYIADCYNFISNCSSISDTPTCSYLLSLADVSSKRPLAPRGVGHQIRNNIPELFIHSLIELSLSPPPDFVVFEVSEDQTSTSIQPPTNMTCLGCSSIKDQNHGIENFV